jgi:hypothetical protein
VPTHELAGSIVDVERDRNIVRKVRDEQPVPEAQDVADATRCLRGGQHRAHEPCATEDADALPELLDRRNDQGSLARPVTYLERDQ